MSHDNTSLAEVDAALEQFSSVAVPVDVKIRLEARVREFGNLSPPPGEVVPERERPHRTRFVGASLVAVLAAMVLVAFFVVIGPQDAWAQVEKALRSKPWVRWTIRLPEGVDVPDGFEPPELWFSAEKKIFAGRMGELIHFVDLRSQESYDYLPQNKVITRSLTSDLEGVEAEHFETLFRLLSEGDRAKIPTDNPIQILSQSRRTIQDGGKRWVESTFKCRDPRRTVPEYHVTFRADPATQLPVEMRSTEKLFPADKFPERVYSIDYPDSGPLDVYALGAPADAQMVDRRRAKVRTPQVIKEFLAAYVKARQKPIDPLKATILLSSPEKDFSDIHQAYRARDNGKELVFEQADFQQLMQFRRKIWKREKSAPLGADAYAWWNEQLAGVAFSSARAIDEYLPHRIGYPQELLTLGASPIDNPDCKVTLDWKPTTGPADTVLLRITTETTVGYNDNFFWIARDRDFLVLRTEIHFSKDHAAWNNSTRIIDGVEKSPGGRWYATSARMGRIERHGAELPTETVKVTGTPQATETDVGPVTTSSCRFLVEFK